MPQNIAAPDEYTTPDLSGLLGAVLGKSVKQNTDATQNTTNASSATNNQNTTQTGLQQTSGNTAQNSQTSGSSSMSGSSSGSSDSSTSGTSRTTGTIDRTTNSQQTDVGSQQTSADLAALRDVYAKQSAGITPEMLQAIFQQGAKAAPQLVTANAQALGTRMAGNTPVAQVLGQLQVDLTSKAADLNRQMLSDSGVTAAKIGDLTKLLQNTNKTTGSSTSQDVQNLLTATDSKQIAHQIMQNVQNTNSNQATSGNTTNNQTVASASNANVVGSSTANQTQNVASTQNQTTNTTINTQVAGQLAKLFAGGVAIDQLFRAATGKGFLGTIQDFAKQLIGQGADPSKVNAGLVAAGVPPTGPNDTSDTNPLPENEFPPLGEYIPPVIPPLTGDTTGDIIPYDPELDGGGYADGGMPGAALLPIEQLIKQRQIVGNPDSDLDRLLASLLGGKEQKASAGSGSGSDAGTGESGSSGGPSAGGGDAVGGSGNGVGTGSGAGTSTGSIGTLGDLGATLGNLSRGAGIVGGFMSGNPLGVIGAFNSLYGWINAPSSAPAQGILSESNLDPGLMGPVDTTPAQTNAELGITAAPDVSIQGMDSIGQVDSAPSSSTDGYAGDVGYDSGSNDVGGNNSVDGSNSDSGDGGDFADGGEVDEDSFMLEALGITKDRKSGSLTFSAHGVRNLHNVINNRSTNSRSGLPLGMSNGGKIVGPGSGTSDSVPAQVGNKRIQVADGEYIVPADVVQKFGADAFDQLVAAHHVPADMQQAITGRR